MATCSNSSQPNHVVRKLLHREVNSLQQSAPAVIRPTVTVKHFARNTPHIIVIIPSQLCSSMDICQCKECHPWETQVMGVHKHILDKHIWTA